eukprot:5344430-Amphidinium_carterae.1
MVYLASLIQWKCICIPTLLYKFGSSKQSEFCRKAWAQWSRAVVNRCSSSYMGVCANASSSSSSSSSNASPSSPHGRP